MLIEPHPSDDEPFAALAFKIMTDPFVGRLTYFRVYSGKLEAGSYVYNATKDKKERVARLLQMHANKREEITEVLAGDICAAIGLKDTRTGDTLCDDARPVILEAMKFAEPVISMSIEPKSKADQDKLVDRDAEARGGRSDVPGAQRSRDRPGDHLRDGRAAPRDHRRPHAARVQGRCEHRPPAGRVSRDDQEARREGRRKVHSPVGRQGSVRPRRDQHRAGRSRQGFVFVDKIVGGTVPREFIKPAEAGMREALENGILAGYPMVDVKAELVYGSYHDVDSSEMAFKIAGSMAIKDAARQAGPVILEPIMEVEVVSPEDFLGSVIGDLSSRRGKIGSMNQRGESQVVAAQVPLAEMFGYSTSLRSATQGRASYTMQFHHYEEVPKAVAEQIISKAAGK